MSRGWWQHHIPGPLNEGVIEIILRLLHILKDEKGLVEMTSFVLLSWIVIMMAVAILEIFLAGSTFVAVNNTAQHALEMMRIKGKLTPEIERSFFKELEQAGINTNNVRILSATKHIAHRGEPVHLHVEAKYTIRSFRPIGIKDGFNLYWNINKTGISRMFVRDIVVSGG